MAEEVRESRIWDESFKAGADLSSHQYKIVKLDSTVGQVVLAGAGEGIGVLQNKPGLGQAAEVRLFGMSRMVLNGNAANLEAGDAVKSDANGIGVRATVANDLPIAFATSQATADGVVEAVMLLGPFRIHA